MEPKTQKTEIKMTTLPKAPEAKACLFNLIIYTHDARRAAYFKDVIRMVTSMFPCRIIFIWGDEKTKEPYLKVSLANQEEASQGNINCDQIFIEVGKEYLNRVPFIILPYIIADLPIYLLWGQDPTTESDILPRLQKYATRLIFDSECSENLQKFSLSMIEKAEKDPIEITDMNWARISGWKEVLIQTFDTPERIEHLSSSKTIKIIYNNRSSDISLHPETQSIYLQSWLATQLKWKIKKIEKEGSNLILYYENMNSKEIIVHLQGQVKENLAAEEILEFEATDQSNFLYSLGRKGNDQIIVHCNTMDRCELPFTLYLPTIWSGRSFMQEIFYKKTSRQYFRMLNLISQLPWCH